MSEWSYTVGEIPHKVEVFERSNRGGVLYLRWRAKDASGRPNWAYRSLRKTLRTSSGRVIKSVQQWAVEQAKLQHQDLLKDLPPDERMRSRLTIREGFLLSTHPETGKYPVVTPHVKEVTRSIQYAMKVLGAEKPWDTITPGDLRKLWRARIKQQQQRGHKGHRSAVIIVRDLLTVAQWLRDEQLIPHSAAIAPRHWKEELSEDWQRLSGSHKAYEPSRPRHTIEHMRAILKASHEIDPRFALLMALGAELRLGQVKRARRLDLDCAAGTLRVYGRGKKGGTIVRLTAGQAKAVDEALAGYLSELEAAGGDYPLFPQGRLRGGKAHVEQLGARPVDGTTIRSWFRAAEELAGIEHVQGRLTYGVRRVAVDEAKREGISPDALKHHGGWKDLQVPDTIYTDPMLDSSIEEAKNMRAKIRGEE